uniref:Putative secreted protein n=1 Tax=Ixodes ricinus TaxID=34613 RepID=A0A6B0USV4_IXORI
MGLAATTCASLSFMSGCCLRACRMQLFLVENPSLQMLQQKGLRLQLLCSERRWWRRTRLNLKSTLQYLQTVSRLPTSGGSTSEAPREGSAMWGLYCMAPRISPLVIFLWRLRTCRSQLALVVKAYLQMEHWKGRSPL